jgi:HEPN domain-containing protein
MKVEKIWLRKSLSDLEVATFNFKWKKFYVAAFFSQQAAEKALKAVYIKKFGKLIKAHDLVLIGKKVGIPPNLLKKCMPLSRAYVVTRYPDVEEIYTSREVEDFIKTAEEVIKWAKKKLK